MLNKSLHENRLLHSFNDKETDHETKNIVMSVEWENEFEKQVKIVQKETKDTTVVLVIWKENNRNVCVEGESEKKSSYDTLNVDNVSKDLTIATLAIFS